MDLLFIGLIILIALIGLWFLIPKKKKLRVSQCEKAISRIQATQSLAPAHSILEAHKIFVATLESLAGSKRGAAKVTKQFEKRFPNSKTIWKFHRLRNQIAHEVEIKIGPHQSVQAREAFARALKSLT